MMERKRNTDSFGNSWSEKIFNDVWVKGSVISSLPSDIWRRDVCSRVVRFSDRGERNSYYGWEIDHIVPVVLGGSDDISNLQPLHWENNASKGDQLDWDCPG